MVQSDDVTTVGSEGKDRWHFPTLEVLPGVRVQVSIQWEPDACVLQITRSSDRQWHAVSPADYRMYFDGSAAIPNLFGLIREETGVGRIEGSALLHFCGGGAVEITPAGEGAYLRGDVDVRRKLLRVDFCVGDDGFAQGLYTMQPGTRTAAFRLRFVDPPCPRSSPLRSSRPSRACCMRMPTPPSGWGGKLQPRK